MQQRRTFQQLQQQHRQAQKQQVFTASELAEYEYCPLVWWYQRYEPLVEADTDELFARMVEMEQSHGPQATALPEYQVIEQLLVRRGAFAEGQEQHRAHADEVAELTGMSDVEDEYAPAADVLSAQARRRLRTITLVLIIVALAVIVAAFLLTPR